GVLAGVGGGGGLGDSQALVIARLQGAPDRGSGGDVLVRLDVPADVPLTNVQVSANGADVTRAFLPAATGHALIGLVTGLQNGKNAFKPYTPHGITPPHNA